MEGNSEFSSESMGLRAQKKILGKMASRSMAKRFISDTTARVLDKFYYILKDYYNKKEAEKVVKNVIKLVIKLAVLDRNQQFSAHERSQLHAFQQKFRMLCMTVVSFLTVDYSYDRGFIVTLLDQCQNLLESLVKSHLSAKSLDRLSCVFDHMGEPRFLDAVFRQNSPYAQQMQEICLGLNKLMEQGDL